MSDWKPFAAIGLIVIAFATKPPIQAFKSQIDASFAQGRQNTWAQGDIGTWGVLALADTTRSGQYHDYYLASTYTVSVGGSPMLNCYGVFGSVFCSAAGKK